MDEFQKISDTYEIIGKIGSGGGGEVYKAYHKRLLKDVVIKKIHSSVMNAVNQRAEADILKNLHHPYLPQVFDYLVIDQAVFTVMDFIPGKSFQQLLDEQTTFTQKQIMFWARQLTEAVQYLHKQNPPIIHGDIKPDNIILTPEGNICLIDFNISSAYGEGGARTIGHTDGYSPVEQYVIKMDNASVTASGLGSINYSNATGAEYQTEHTSEKTELLMAESTELLSEDKLSAVKTELLFEAGTGEKQTELLTDTRQGSNPNQNNSIRAKAYAIINERSDIYSIGATLYHMLTGIRPGKAGTAIKALKAINPKYGDGIVYVIERAMEQSPEKRFASTDQMLKVIMNYAKIDKRYKRMILRSNVVFGIILVLLVYSAVLVNQGWEMIKREETEQYQTYISAMEVSSMNGEYSSVEDIYIKALTLKTDDIAPYYYRCFAMYQMNQYDEIITFYKEAVENRHFSDSKMLSDFHFILGNTYFEKNEYIDAVKHFETAIELNPVNGEIYRDYAISLARVNMLPQAGEALQQAVELKVETDSLLLVSGEIALRSGKYEEAEKDVLQCIASAKDDYMKMRAYLLCGEIYDTAYGEGKTTLASEDGNDEILLKKIQVLSQAKQVLPRDLSLGIYEGLAQAYIDSGDYYNDKSYYVTAIDIFMEEIANGWGSYNTYYNLALLYQMTGQTESASEQLLKMKDLYGEDYVVFKRLAFLEIDVQAALENQNRDYDTFLNYYKNAFDLYEEAKKNNKSDNEMQLLTSVYERLQEGGWFNE